MNHTEFPLPHLKSEVNQKDQNDLKFHKNESCHSIQNDQDITEAVLDFNSDNEEDSQVLHGTKLVMCIVSTCLCFFLVSLDQTITAAIISEVSAKFKSFDEITWITSGFFLGTGALCQIWGQASSIWGRKWIMVLGIFIFELGSLISAVSQSMKMLIIGRVLQGLGGANIEILAILICTEVSSLEYRPIVFAVVSLVYMIASVIGPIIGGLFASYVSWRWVHSKQSLKRWTALDVS
ncbi:unnamed protein product [Ambrosiozyma monospora]|uniref:Unnamed protein product n=1 Tax=Ambrosiozyma monospora TaxID=43982 RepID=A0ACB5U672_AMBMO|nr:unnamed protein product [Ambrosiozyma monospora]